MINPEVESFFQGELKDGEVLVWSAAPAAKRLARKGWFLVVFGIPWTAFAIFWVAGASGFRVPNFSEPSGFFPLFGVPFILIGIGLLTSPWWLRREARHTGYFITNRRAVLIRRNVFGEYTVRSFYPKSLQTLERVQLADGSGDLILERYTTRDSDGDKSVNEVGFYGVPDVKEVESLLTELAQSAKGA